MKKILLTKRSHAILSILFILAFYSSKSQTVNTFTANNLMASDTISSGVLIRSQCITASDTMRAEKDMIIDQNLRVNGSADFSNNILVGKNASFGSTSDFVSFGYSPATSSSPSILKFYPPSSGNPPGSPIGTPNSPDPTPNLACTLGLNYINSFGGAISVHQNASNIVTGTGGNIVLGHTGNRAFIETQGTGGSTSFPGDLYMNSTCNRNVLFFTHPSGFNNSTTNVVSIAGKVGMSGNMQIGALGTGFIDNNSRLYVLADVSSQSNGIKIRHVVPSGGTFGIKIIEQMDSDKAFAIFKTANTVSEGTERFSILGNGKTQISTTNSDAFVISDANNNNQINFAVQSNGSTEILNAAPTLKAFAIKSPAENFLVYGNGQTHISTNEQIGFVNSAIQDNTARLHLNILSPEGSTVNKALKITTNNNAAQMIVVNNINSGNTPFLVLANGTTKIGAGNIVGTHTDAMLQVSGKVACQSLYVLKPTTWQDRVFFKNYKLPKILEVENYINKHKHLPGIQSEEEILSNGYDINKMDAALLEKIENLYLYVIEQQKEIEILKKKLNEKN